MKLVEKNKLIKILEKIQSGHFDENDIDNLFMKLRPYSSGFEKFREISDFVAHNDERDRGIINRAIENRYLMFKYIRSYNPEKGNLIINNSIPLWVIKLITYEAEKIEDSYFLLNFNFSRKSFLKEVKDSYTIDKKAGTATYNKDSISIEFIQAFSKCLSTLKLNSVLTQDAIIEETIGVLKKNNVKFDEAKIRNQSNKITVCLILLLHNATYTADSKYLGKTILTYDLKFNEKFTFMGGKIIKELIDIESYGKLCIEGIFKIEDTENPVYISSKIMETNLIVEEWCDESIFTIIETTKGTSKIYPEFNEELCLNEEGKISKIK
ncbi:hypothetical protein PGK01_11010 [Acinetobacter baumannii]|uniref:hypothetical protein n=1 Tax=Acinetobacter baumannii TaxID=470 RepID=UPI0022EC4C82|nr:hypothetical protein [Acinetobacter baumannii]HEO1844806.1 hypothetical protein [Acinetobacter baumannii]